MGMMKLDLNDADRRTIRYALFLAIQWEDSLSDAWQPEFGKPDAEAKKAIASSKRYIKKFKRIYKKFEKRLKYAKT